MPWRAMIAPKARLEPGIDTGRRHGTVLAQPRQEVLQGETFRKDGAGPRREDSRDAGLALMRCSRHGE